MAITIPKNPYVKPTAIRENVVQSICDFFLLGNIWKENEFYYFNNKTNHLLDFSVKQTENDFLIPTEYEMKAAFDALLKAGYFLFENYIDGYGYQYVCSEKSFYKDKSYKLWNLTNTFKVRLD